MRADKVIQVLYHERLVGRLAVNAEQKVAFEYDDEWIEQGFSISPFSLPLKKQVYVPAKMCFGGLFGVFADSLPDAWGQILLRRVLRKNGQNVNELSALDRMAIVGSSGMGALTYEPQIRTEERQLSLNLDKLAMQCEQILTTEYDGNLDELYQLGGTSGGASPKILTRINKEDWIIKFPAHVDSIDAGKMEYEYSLCAKKCGIDMTDTKLFDSERCLGYFGIRRFDRENAKQQKVHMCTAAALLEADFEQPCMDYWDLMKLTKIMTNNNKHDLENMFLRMCFNVFAHNRDDHAKNFSFLYKEEEQQWRLSPAYDLTFSSTYYGEHTISIDGNGSNPGEEDLMRVGTEAGISTGKCKELMSMVHENVAKDLAQYL
ncbi:MAG: type II toxin-antitoxin system HipA family toxin [Hespellia sp.]|nr:type II toxin-antitoxin system HipA family toxin [Hespellia sp.]